MRRLLWGLVAAISWFACGHALAQAPVGVWVVDQDAWQHEVDELIGLLLAQVPEEQRELARQQGIDFEAMLRAEMSTGLEGELELQEGGTALTRQGDGNTDQGRWSLDGNVITLNFSDDSSQMRGPLEGDSLILSAIPPPDATPEERAMLEHLTLTLNRK